MADHPQLEDIPTGCTCAGVNEEIVRYLLARGHDFRGKHILDIPCGEGALALALQRCFPGAVVSGCDRQTPEALASERFSKVDASRPFRAFPETEFTLVLCVSGVMEFDNTLQFFTSCREHLADGGMFIVTNDNVMTVQDRLRFLLFGKFRHFGLFVKQGQPTWKVIPIYNLTRLLEDAGFTIREIRYASVTLGGWLTLPLAWLLYPFQFLYMRSRAEVSARTWLQMYPFRSLLAQHYILFCTKAAIPQAADAIDDGKAHPA